MMRIASRTVIFVAAAALVLTGCSSSKKKAPSGGASGASGGSGSGIAGVTVVDGLPHTHYQGVHLTYTHSPPLGGDHSPAPLNCAVYTTAVPNENAVHSLEHGGVWLTYQPGVDPAPLLKLDAIDPNYVLISPYPGQSSKVIATAWGLQLKVDSTTDPRLKGFVEKYHGGGQGGEKGAPCQGVNVAQAQQLFAQGPPSGQGSPPVPADKPGGN
ncbi:MAG TPA: DUF3105 domain-containing protein [Frankiaceae bacterium]|jgi:hypothetical protein|nr:DUF3105 domain-containing protein [Frankiaceae bacterium]